MNEELTSKAEELEKKRARGRSPDPAESPAVPDEEVAGDGIAPSAEGGEAVASSADSVAPEDLEELRKKAEESDLYLNELLRTRADFENFQRRTRKERPALEARAVRGLILDLLPVKDNFERALVEESGANLESLEKGLRLIQQMFFEVLENHQVSEIEAEGKPFDPQLHHAVQQVETGDESNDGIVMEVLEKGYTHAGSVVRPSRVVVGKRTAPDRKSST